MQPVVLITGAGSGIGRATALSFAGRGARLMLAGRRAEPLEETASACIAVGAHARWRCCDVGDPAQVDALYGEIEAHYGRLDILFNNAGSGSRPLPLEDTATDDWLRVLTANVTGAFLCTRSAFKLMKSQVPGGGRIINNGSISAHSPRPFAAAYTVSKHAITGLTKSAALEGRRYNIACGQIDIGNAQTDMTGRMSSGVPQADGRIAAEPLMDVRHVADAVVHMAELPLDANVLFMTIMATGMPFVGRG